MLFKIPFIRGIASTVKQKFMEGNVFIVDQKIIIFLCLYVVTLFFPKLYLLDILYFIYHIIMINVVKNNKRIAEIHGAEHMIANYYEKYNQIDFKDVKCIRKESISHERCGTISYIFNIIIVYSLILITDNFLLRLVIATAISNELFYDFDNKIVKVIFYPFFKLGKFIQNKIFVLPPKDIDIQMAIQTIHKLEEAEENIDKNKII